MKVKSPEKVSSNELDTSAPSIKKMTKNGELKEFKDFSGKKLKMVGVRLDLEMDRKLKDKAQSLGMSQNAYLYELIKKHADLD